MKGGAPLRFLALLLGGWTCLRVGMIAPGWWSEASTVAALPAARPERRDRLAGTGAGLRPLAAGTRSAATTPSARPAVPVPSRQLQSEPARSAAIHARPGPAATSPQPPHARADGTWRADPIFAPAQPSLGASSPAPHAPARRWSGSAWLLARGEGENALAPGGTLGGSQAGMRLLYRLNRDAARPVSLSARLYSPLRRTREAEAALGMEWRPIAVIPVQLLVERRQRLGRDGRSAFAAAVHGGGSGELGRGWRLDAYAQAGIVGTRSRDAFVDGAARVSRPLGPIEAGAALWGAAQPGAARLDAGPLLTLPLRDGRAGLRLSAEYRFRIAGDARPASGPALTLGVDF